MADATQPKSPRACANCLSELADNARFCALCGSPAPVAAPPAQDPVRDVLKVALGRQYEIQRLLGKGGMGAVYLATEAALERDVAIKVLPPDRGATKDSRDRFRREARTAARLSHPNIVPLYTFGDVDGTLYFVMGYVEGESLAARLKREGRLPIEDARRILIEVADALDYAHKLGVIHRDIKPDNVLLEEGTGRALLTDFGVAKALGAGQTMTEVGSVLGTPQYMSPEQAQGKADIDHRSDLYSLAVMGYAMLTGRLPFEGATPGDVMVQHITREAPALKSIAPEVPPEIAAALTRCLAKDPGARWPDANTLKGALTVRGEDDREMLIPALGSLRRLTDAMSLLLPLSLHVGLNTWLLPRPRSILFGRSLPGAFLAVVALVSLGILTSAAELRRQGYGWKEIGLEALLKPSWWPLYYPRRFRARHDVWERLPLGVRRYRGYFTAALISGFVILPAVILVQFHGGPGQGDGSTPAVAIRAFLYRYHLIGPLFSIPLALFAVAAWIEVRNRRTLRKKGFADDLLRHADLRDSADAAFWSRPEFAALLLPAERSRSLGSPVPSSPRDLVSAISTAVSRLAGESREVGARARDAARSLASSIAAVEGEIASIESAGDPAEAERLVARLAALGAPSADEGSAKSQMRDVFQKQLDLLRGFESRLGQLKTKRASQLELLRALWSQATELPVVANGAARASGAADRMRTLCAEIAGQLGETSANLPATEAISEAPTIERS